MSDLLERTPPVSGLDGFNERLGDALEAHADALAAAGLRTASRRGTDRWPRRLALVAATAMAVTLALAAGLVREHGPAPASAADLLRGSARAVSSGTPALPPGSYWHTRLLTLTRRADPTGFEYASTTRWDIWRRRDGAGRERVLPVGEPSFPTAADRRAWRAGGAPRLGDAAADQRVAATRRPFHFGMGDISYRQLQALPTDPRALGRALARVAARQPALPPGFDASQARAYSLFALIRDSFEAPTTGALRASLYRLAASTPGLRLDGSVTDAAGRRGSAVSAVLGAARFVLVIDARSGRLLETRRVLLRRSPQFPGMSPGLISRATMLAAGVTARAGR